MRLSSANQFSPDVISESISYGHEACTCIASLFMHVTANKNNNHICTSCLSTSKQDEEASLSNSSSL